MFECKLKNIHVGLLLESIFVRKKILWRIVVVLIKCSVSALLFEKSLNECENPSFLHKAMRIGLDRGSTKLQHCLSTFMALNSTRFWSNTHYHFFYKNLDHT